MIRAMSRVLIRETLVLALGILLAAIAALAFQGDRDGLHLLCAIVVPIFFCLGRAAFAPSPPRNAAAIRRFIHQVLVALALTMLFVFETVVGLFAGAKDIRVVVWTVVSDFAIVYVAIICITESMGKPAASPKTDCS